MIWQDLREREKSSKQFPEDNFGHSGLRDILNCPGIKRWKDWVWQFSFARLGLAQHRYLSTYYLSPILQSVARFAVGFWTFSFLHAFQEFFSIWNEAKSLMIFFLWWLKVSIWCVTLISYETRLFSFRYEKTCVMQGQDVVGQVSLQIS